jgi:hypothetical protein
VGNVRWAHEELSIQLEQSFGKLTLSSIFDYGGCPVSSQELIIQGWEVSSELMC